MVISVFLAALVVALSGALVPGPLLTITVNESLKRGARAGPLITVGHGFLELILVIALILGLQHLLVLPAVKFWMSLAGGAILGYISLTLLRVAGKPLEMLPWEGVESCSNQSARDWLSPVWAGVVTSLVNPYWFLWWGTIGAAMLFQSQELGYIGIAAFYLGHISGDLGYHSMVSIAVATGRRWLNQIAYRWIMACCGGFLIILAAYFLYHASQLSQAVFLPR